MSIVNIDSFVKAKQMKSMHAIVTSEIDSRNLIGKQWLQSLDKEFSTEYFLSSCPDVSGLCLQKLPRYYQKLVISWTTFKSLHEPLTKSEILAYPLFGSTKIKYNGKPLLLQNFAKSCLQAVGNIWDDDLKTFHSEAYIFNKLLDKRNWISYWSKINMTHLPNYTKK